MIDLLLSEVVAYYRSSTRERRSNGKNIRTRVREREVGSGRRFVDPLDAFLFRCLLLKYPSAQLGPFWPVDSWIRPLLSGGPLGSAVAGMVAALRVRRVRCADIPFSLSRGLPPSLCMWKSGLEITSVLPSGAQM